MTKLFFMGGPIFMGILTLLLIVLLTVSVLFILKLTSGKSVKQKRFTHQLSYLKSIGLFSMIVGILGQLIGLVLALNASETVNDISPAIMLGGLKISMISTLYGIIIYLVSLIIWFMLDLYHQKQLTTAQNE